MFLSSRIGESYRRGLLAFLGGCLAISDMAFDGSGFCADLLTEGSDFVAMQQVDAFQNGMQA